MSNVDFTSKWIERQIIGRADIQIHVTTTTYPKAIPAWNGANARASNNRRGRSELDVNSGVSEKFVLV